MHACDPVAIVMGLRYKDFECSIVLQSLACTFKPNLFTALFNNMWILKFKAQPS